MNKNITPWEKTHQRIQVRCCYDKKSSYYGRIKNYLKIKDLKYLWFRDKAYLMKTPSIDRMDSKGNYTLENCRYIELKENTRARPIRCIETGRIFPSLTSVSKQIGCRIPHLWNVLNGKGETVFGLHWKYNY